MKTTSPRIPILPAGLAAVLLLAGGCLGSEVSEAGADVANLAFARARACVDQSNARGGVLSVPECGTYNPADWIALGPYKLLTFASGTARLAIGRNFYNMAGCRPTQSTTTTSLSDGTGSGSSTSTAVFTYNNGGAAQSLLSGLSITTVLTVGASTPQTLPVTTHTMTYDSRGFLARAESTCLNAASGQKASTYATDPLGRLSTITTQTPRGCNGQDSSATLLPPNDTTDVTTYSYTDPDDLLPARLSRTADNASIVNDYYYDYSTCRMTGIRQTTRTPTTLLVNELGYSYDSLGRLVAERSISTASPTAPTTTVFTYDGAGRLLTIDFTNTTNIDTVFTYNSSGNLTEVVLDASQTYTLTY